MSFILRLPMLSKHSLNPKHSSQQSPNSLALGASVIAAAVPHGLGFPPGLWLSVFSRGLGCSLRGALQ